MTDTIESLRQQLAECKATNWMLRGFVDQFLAENDTTEFGCACHPGEGYVCGTCQAFDRQLPLRQALALPNDATALNELIAERTKELTTQRDAAMMNAERYRFIREQSYVAVSSRKECLWIPKGIFEIPGKGFDAAVDAARANCNNKEEC